MISRDEEGPKCEIYSIPPSPIYIAKLPRQTTNVVIQIGAECQLGGSCVANKVLLTCAYVY